MLWFKNRKTLAKLVMAFCLMALFISVVGYMGIGATQTVNGMLSTLYERDMTGLSAMKEAETTLVKIGREARTAIISQNPAEVESLTRTIDQYFVRVDESLAAANKTIVTEEAKAAMAKAKQYRPKYEDAVRDVLRALHANDRNAAVVKIHEAKEVADHFSQAVNGMVTAKERLGKKAYEESGMLFSQLRSRLIGIVVASVILCLGIGYFIAQLIAKPLGATVGILGKVAEFDLSTSLNIETKDEVGQMAQALNATVDALRTALGDVRQALEKVANGDLTVSLDENGMKGEVRRMAEALNRTIGAMRHALNEVRTSAENMASSAQELASASEELSSGAQEQASSLEETTATLEEITSTVKQNADNARQASQVASGSRDTAEKGGQVVSEAVSAMGEINEASKNIAEIITTIDEIAFQTNLLALNAAVEAARAGEQGRGFAVVATEVRNLAQRSASSAKEIKRLIQDSVRKVENGSGLVNKSGETLQEIIGSVKRVTDIVGEIASASREQSAGIEQVNKAMIQMDQVTQTNSSQTEELSATSQTLATYAEQLQGLVQRFKVDVDGARHVQVAAPSKVAVKAPAPARVAGRAASKPRHREAMPEFASAPVPPGAQPNGDDADQNAFVNF